MTESLAEVMNSQPHAARRYPAPSSRSVAKELVRVCDEAKGSDVTVLDVGNLSSVCDFFVIVSARSDRHVQGLCNKVLETLAPQHVAPVAIEGLEKGHWVVMDFGDVVMHVFYEPLRSHFDLEGLWARAPRVTLEEKARSSSPRSRKEMSARA